MWHDNQFTQLMGIKYPIVQAPMAGGITSPELVAAVSNNGALGSLGAAYMQPSDLEKSIRAIQSKTRNPFLVNLFSLSPICPSHTSQQKMCGILNKICEPLSMDVSSIEPPYLPDFDEQFNVLLDMQVSIVSFIFGIPEKKYIDQLKNHNVKIIGTATCLDEALNLTAAGVDAIVAQGIESGGHRGTFTTSVADDSKLPTFALVAQLCEKIDLPITAAGGIANGVNIHAALSSGAQACQIGTAFLTTHEANTHALYKKALLNTSHNTTTLTRAFSGRFARGIHNQFIELMRAYEKEILPFPIQNKLTKQIRLAAAEQNNPDFMSLWAGQSAHECRSMSAA